MRHNLDISEGIAGNFHRARNHWIIAANSGCKESLDFVKEGFMDGMITKNEYENTLLAYQRGHDEMKSDDRDKAKTATPYLYHSGCTCNDSRSKGKGRHES